MPTSSSPALLWFVAKQDTVKRSPKHTLWRKWNARTDTLSALLQFASASVEYREISGGIVREKSQSSLRFPISTGRHAPPTLAQCNSSSLPPKVDTPAAFVWLPLVIGSDVCGRGDTIQ